MADVAAPTFRELALAELEAVHRMAFHLARQPDLANDLVQETYLRALKAEHTFELRERGIRPWLFKILHNVFYTHMGKKQRAPSLIENPGDDLASATTDQAEPAWDLASLDWEQIDERLKHAIDDLPENYRSVLLLWAVEGLKYREIAQVLDIPLGTIMSRLHRARSLLTGRLADLAREAGIGRAGRNRSEDAQTSGHDEPDAVATASTASTASRGP